VPPWYGRASWLRILFGGAISSAQARRLGATDKIVPDPHFSAVSP
jgi:hypothetical protein